MPPELLALGAEPSGSSTPLLTAASTFPALEVASGDTLTLAETALVIPPLEVALPVVLVASVLGPPDAIALVDAPGMAPLVDAAVDVPPPAADSVAEATGAVTPLLDSVPVGAGLPLGAVVQAVEVSTPMSTMECFIVTD